MTKESLKQFLLKHACLCMDDSDRCSEEEEYAFSASYAAISIVFSRMAEELDEVEKESSYRNN